MPFKLKWIVFCWPRRFAFLYCGEPFRDDPDLIAEIFGGPASKDYENKHAAQCSFYCPEGRKQNYAGFRSNLSWDQGTYQSVPNIAVALSIPMVI